MEMETPEDTEKRELFAREAERLYRPLVTRVSEQIAGGRLLCETHPDAEDIVHQTLLELLATGAYAKLTGPGQDAEKLLYAAVNIRLQSYFRTNRRLRRVLVTEDQLQDRLGDAESEESSNDVASPIRSISAPELLTFVTGRAKGRRRLFYFPAFVQPHWVQNCLEAGLAARVDIEQAVCDAALPDITVDAVRWRFIEEQGLDECAQKLGYDGPTVRTLLQRARQQLANQDRLAAYRPGQLQAPRRWKRATYLPKTLKVDCPFCWRFDAGVRPFTCARCGTAIGRGAEPAFTVATATPLRFAHRALIDLRDQFRAVVPPQTSLAR